MKTKLLILKKNDIIKKIYDLENELAHLRGIKNKLEDELVKICNHDKINEIRYSDGHRYNTAFKCEDCDCHIPFNMVQTNDKRINKCIYY